MAAETTGAARWHATVAHAAATGTVPWQIASLAIGLVAEALLAIRGLASPPIWLTLSALHGLAIAAGLWLSLRLRIDAVLFRALVDADGPDGLDRAMVEVGFVRADKASRPLPDRVAGLFRLIRRLVLVVAMQLALLGLTGWLSWQ